MILWRASPMKVYRHSAMIKWAQKLCSGNYIAPDNSRIMRIARFMPIPSETQCVWCGESESSKKRTVTSSIIRKRKIFSFSIPSRLAIRYIPPKLKRHKSAPRIASIYVSIYDCRDNQARILLPDNDDCVIWELGQNSWSAEILMQSSLIQLYYFYVSYI